MSYERDKQKGRADAVAGKSDSPSMGFLDGLVSSKKDRDELDERRQAYREGHEDKKREIEQEKKRR
jgi:hypothetical protein